MTLAEYQEQLLLAALQRTAAPIEGPQWLALATDLALRHGATPGHLRGMDEPLLRRLCVTRELRAGDRVLYAPVAGPKVAIPEPPALPDRPLARSHRARDRRHAAAPAGVSPLRAPRTQLAPADPESLRAFAEDAARLLLRTQRDMEALRRRFLALPAKRA